MAKTGRWNELELDLCQTFKQATVRQGNLQFQQGKSFGDLF